ncbi:MAG: Arm DNA-binding domain-containing protein [Rikenellaceae bacterium]
MKRKTFGVLFFINKAKLLKSGEAGIYIRINVDGKRAEANIKRSVEVKNWDQSKEMAKGRDRKSNEINDCIRDLKLRALSIHKELELRGKFFTSRLILDMIFNNESAEHTILKVFRKHNEECRKLIGIDYAKITISRFDNRQYVQHSTTQSGARYFG